MATPHLAFHTPGALLTTDETSNSKHISRFYLPVLLASAFVVSILFSPLALQSVNRDSGAFAYIGWRILEGEVPYRDVWDHKPPLIFFINALGLLLGNGSYWGIWALEAGSLLLATAISYHLLKNLYGGLCAFAATSIWVMTMPFLIDGGNLTTEFTLPVQFLVFLLTSNSRSLFGSPGRSYAVGLLGGILFFLKQTAIGVIIALTAYLLFFKLRAVPKHVIRCVGLMLAGYLT